jgi:UDP-N-acetylmuramate--alanine ligase
LNEQDHISFEIVGTKNGVTLIDDYAHHPTAVKETLNAAKLKYPNSKIWAVFEPHTFSRTQATLKELATSFDSADQVLISEIYPARENIKEATISSEQVINEIRGNALKLKSADSVRLVHNKSEALEILKNELKPTDVVVVMAVGDFNRLAYELKEAL